MATLYELKSEYQFLLTLLQDENEDEQVVNDTLECVQGDIEDKLEAYKIIDTELESQEAKYSKEIERLVKIKSSLEKNRKKLKENMYEMVKLLPNQKAQSSHFKFSIAKNGGKAPLVIPDQTKVPAGFCKMVPDLELIRKDLEQGVSMTWASLGERGTHLLIK